MFVAVNFKEVIIKDRRRYEIRNIQRMVLSLSKCVQRAVGLVGWSTVARKTNKRSNTQCYSIE